MPSPAPHHEQPTIHHLQALICELLIKNQQLRLDLARREQPPSPGDRT